MLLLCSLKQSLKLLLLFLDLFAAAYERLDVLVPARQLSQQLTVLGPQLI